MDRLSNLLGALGVAVTDDVIATMVEASGLAVSEAACLNVVAHNDGCSLRLLSGTLGITHPGTVRLVDRLASADLVKRGTGPDRRTVGLHLTAAGRRRWVRQRDARGRRLDAVVDQLTAQQRDAACSAIETLLATFTTNALQAERVCRFCDESACPQQQCPVTCAVES
jgi:MarR family transcriptional regulator, negative regulator of the multidrug operon emrRAB